MDKQVVILGAGESGRVIGNIFVLNGRKVVFLDDHSTTPDTVGRLSDFTKFPEAEFFVSFGNDALRKTWYETLAKAGVTFANAIHPEGYVEKNVTLGHNVMVGAFTYINIMSRIGSNVIINNHCTIEHDNVIEDHVQIAPGVTTGGGVIIKKSTFIGMGSIIRDHLTIEEHTVVGAGAVVVDHIQEKGGLHLGLPAKKIKDVPHNS